ncbi:acyltransferase [Winogradskyella marincola]|uniref:DapH/DapD/GlmU-related protein n=1 Tax=Winogradskyella marincola TaxID=3037795 RepID=A0ABT6FX10_9FLAO|nr:DapH/DapD/GlmU-related protein [Winogradskyella sp. YYF002]MDG4714325.1 DapH/DapD/GlmU-related protein [Winogradskyella sp. YYF002]
MLKLLSKLIAKYRATEYKVKGDPNRIIIGSNTSIDSSVILNNSKGGTIEIGDNCHIFENVIIATYGGNIKIGSQTSINPFCVLYGHGNLTIGDDVRIATQSVFVPANHNYDELDIPIRKQGLTKKGIIIENNVWIGAGVKVLDGVYIEENVIVAAGSVVNKNIERGLIVGGVPAKLIRNRNK